MRRRIAQIVIMTAACVLADKLHVRAASAVCPPRTASASDDKGPSGPRISIVEVIFSGILQIPITDQDQIADSIKQQDYWEPLDGLVDEAVERVKAGWQDRGYFKVQVSGEEATLTSSPDNRHVAFTFHVDEGVQYSLNEVTFKNNKVITDLASLRGLFPINDGDIFSRAKIASGLDNLRKAYGDLGYMNSTAVPNTKVDDEKKQVSLEIDLDESKRFFVASVNVLGLEEPARQELLKGLPLKRGQLWNPTSESAFSSYLLKYDLALPHCQCREELRMDDRTGAVTVTLDFRPCPTD